MDPTGQNRNQTGGQPGSTQRTQSLARRFAERNWRLTTHRPVIERMTRILRASPRSLQCYLPTSLQSEKIFSTPFKAGFSFLCPTFPCQSPCETGRATDSGRGMFGRGMGCGFAALSLCVCSVPFHLHGFGLGRLFARVRTFTI